MSGPCEGVPLFFVGDCYGLHTFATCSIETFGWTSPINKIFITKNIGPR